jgi:hypothetical protein
MKRKLKMRKINSNGIESFSPVLARQRLRRVSVPQFDQL